MNDSLNLYVHSTIQGNFRVGGLQVSLINLAKTLLRLLELANRY